MSARMSLQVEPEAVIGTFQASELARHDFSRLGFRVLGFGFRD